MFFGAQVAKGFGHEGIVAIAEGLVMHPRKMSYIHEAFELAARRGFEIERHRVRLLVARVVPLGHLRENVRGAAGQASPDQPEPLFYGISRESRSFGGIAAPGCAGMHTHRPALS